MTHTHLRIALLGLLAVLIAAVALVMSSQEDDPVASSTDRAFTAEMTPHHRSAVAMARTALERSTRPEIRLLAMDIIKSQDAEIGQMRAIDARLAADGAPKGRLGGGHGAMGMGEEAALETADPIDRAFIDLMIPHHQGAIQMARIQLAKGGDEETRELAEAVIAAQTREIKQMNAYRTAWYGAPSPAGGVPAA